MRVLHVNNQARFQGGVERILHDMAVSLGDYGGRTISRPLVEFSMKSPGGLKASHVGFKTSSKCDKALDGAPLRCVSVHRFGAAI